MSSDEVYIKMILALPDDFFEGWNWQAGDRAITIPYKREILIIDPPLVQMQRGTNWITAIFPDSAYDEYDMFDKRNLRPLPSQEQLLQIYKTKKELQYDSLALLRLVNWIEDKVTTDHEFCFEYESADVLTLLWVQETCFNQKWNGEAWI